jgi:5-formyltetrahydrofolate cyclo-ligase
LKRLLRSDVRQRRRALDSASRTAHDRAINVALLDLVQHTAASSLAAFWSFDGEPDLSPTLDVLARRGLQVALPVLVDEGSGTGLKFRVWNPAESLVRNRFGIAEPGGGNEISLSELDLVLLPLVAWDEQGHRLGMGAGYYDRALAPLAGSTRPRRIGIAYGVQKVPKVPHDSWDVRLHEVITESGRFTCAA